MTLGENSLALKDPEEGAPDVDEDEEEPEDIQETMKEKCAEQSCSKMKETLDACNERVSSRKETEETCFEEVLDYVHCVDHCVAKGLFSKLK